MVIQKVAMLAYYLRITSCGPRVEHEYVKQQWKQTKNTILGCPKENMTDKSVEVRYHEDRLLPELCAVPG